MNAFLKENTAFKALAVFLALFVWYLSKESGEPIQMSFFTPVVFKNVPDSYQVESDPTQINIVALTRNRESFNPLEIQAVLDLANSKPGQSPYQISERDILSPLEVKIARIQPTQVELTIEELVEIELPIEPRFQGKPKKGFLLDSIAINPATIKVQGPKSVVEPIKRVMTSQIDLNGLDKSLDLIVQLDLPQNNLQIRNQDVEYYTAEIRIKSLPIKKRFDNVPVYLRNTVFVSVINPSVFNVFVEGPAEILNRLQPSEIYGIIDLSESEPGSYQIKPKPVTPDEITVLQQWPTVSLWVKPERIEAEQENVLDLFR